MLHKSRRTVDMAFVSLPCTQYEASSVRRQRIHPTVDSFTNRRRLKSRRHCLQNFCMTAMSKKSSAEKPLQFSDKDMARTAADGKQFLFPSFPDAVSGEWFGFECSFSAVTGTPLCIEVTTIAIQFQFPSLFHTTGLTAPNIFS